MYDLNNFIDEFISPEFELGFNIDSLPVIKRMIIAYLCTKDERFNDIAGELTEETRKKFYEKLDMIVWERCHHQWEMNAAGYATIN